MKMGMNLLSVVCTPQVHKNYNDLILLSPNSGPNVGCEITFQFFVYCAISWCTFGFKFSLCSNKACNYFFPQNFTLGVANKRRVRR